MSIIGNLHKYLRDNIKDIIIISSIDNILKTRLYETEITFTINNEHTIMNVKHNNINYEYQLGFDNELDLMCGLNNNRSYLINVCKAHADFINNMKWMVWK